MPDIHAIKTPDGALMPVPEDVDELDYIGQGEMVSITVTKKRNIYYHRKFFAMLKACWELEAICEHFASIDELRAWLTVRCGWCDTYHFDDNIVAKIPKSISFAKMDDMEFNAFYNKAVNVVLNQFLPEFKPDDFLDYLDQFAGF